MELQKPSIRLLYAWWLALFFGTLALCCAAAALISFSHTLWVWVTAVMLIAFSVGFAWYLPARYRRLAFYASSELVIVHCGVIATRTKYINVKNIRFASMDSALPLALFGLSTATLRTAGAMVRIPGLDADARRRLKATLAPCFGQEEPKPPSDKPMGDIAGGKA